MSYESGEPAANSVMMSGQPWLENLSYFTERTDNWCGSPSGGFPPSMPAASMPATYMPAGVLGRLPHAFTAIADRLAIQRFAGGCATTSTAARS